MSYCEIAKGHPFHGPHHDQEYGFPVDDDRVLLERLALEINQAGLSWLLVLKKRAALNAAFADFDPESVAAFGEADVARLLLDVGIIRNRRKIEAVIENARRVAAIRDAEGSFAAWLARHHPLARGEWVKLFRGTFRFMGPEIVSEFLMSIGYLPGAHDPDCPVFAEIAAHNPPWMNSGKAD